MSLVIPIRGWVNFSGGGGKVLKKDRLRSPEVGISVVDTSVVPKTNWSR